MYRAAQVIKRRQDIAKNSSQSAIPATSNLTDPQPPSISSITRAEFQLLQRNRSALSKVAPFGLFIFVFAEFSPILLLYVTSIVPEQCQLPSVRAKIDRKFNERKYKSFVRYKEHAENTTMGKEDMRLLKAASGGADDRTVSASVISTPSSSASDVKEPTSSLLDALSIPALQHASTALKAHPAFLDRLSFNSFTSGIASLLLTRKYLISRIRRRLAYLRADDTLLLRDGSVEELSSWELERAVAERGYLASSAMGVSNEMRKKQLKTWLRKSIGGSGSARVAASGEDELIRLVLEY